MNETEKKIYDWLCDTESKEIYEARIRFEEAYDYRYVQNYIDKYATKYAEKKWLYLSDSLRNCLSAYSNIIVAGAGQRGKALIQMLRKEGYPVLMAVDNGAGDGYIWDGIEVIKPDKADFGNSCVLVSLSERGVSEQIAEQISTLGVPREDIFLLADYVYPAEEDARNAYFDREILKYGKSETFVDCGACDLETSHRFLEECIEHHAEQIGVYAFEPDRENYQICMKRMDELKASGVNVCLFQAGAWSENKQVSFASGNGAASKVQENREGLDTIEVVTLDSVIREKVTFIKMDIEGAELEALKGAKNLIQAYRPKLAICIYHKPEDLTEIPLYIKSLVPDYKLYVRHYSNNTGELVLYAVV